jgi:hypothetical protein
VGIGFVPTGAERRPAEAAVMDILVDNDLLIFSRDEMLDESVIRCRSARRFEERYLRKGFDNQISVIRILDSHREEFRLSKAYQHKIDVINVVTAPEIEMLIIHNEGAYEQFKKSGKKPSDFCKVDLRMGDVKSYDFVHTYFSNPDTLLQAIKEYRRVANIQKGEYTLSDLLCNFRKRSPLGNTTDYCYVDRSGNTAHKPSSANALYFFLYLKAGIVSWTAFLL